jgi:hypothetical protein
MGDASGSHAGASAAAAGAGFEFGVDPALDPELAMARSVPFLDPSCGYSCLSLSNAGATDVNSG